MIIARGLKGHGIDPNHCMVIFTPLTDSSVFSAGVSMPVTDRESGRPCVFFIRASIAASRDQHFRTAFAEQLFGFFSERFNGAFFYLQYEDVFPENVFYTQGSHLINAAMKDE